MVGSDKPMHWKVISQKVSNEAVRQEIIQLFWNPKVQNVTAEVGWLVNMLKQAARFDHGDKSPTNGAGRVVDADVEITRNQQTARKGKKNLQQVRKFVQEDVSFGSKWAVNNDKIEADWVQYQSLRSINKNVLYGIKK